MGIDAKITDLYNRITAPDTKFKQFSDEMGKVKDQLKNFSTKIQKDTNSKFERFQEDLDRID